jgi:hypothetical protein
MDKWTFTASEILLYIHPNHPNKEIKTLGASGFPFKMGQKQYGYA